MRSALAREWLGRVGRVLGGGGRAEGGGGLGGGGDERAGVVADEVGAQGGQDALQPRLGRVRPFGDLVQDGTGGVEATPDVGAVGALEVDLYAGLLEDDDRLGVLLGVVFDAA